MSTMTDKLEAWWKARYGVPVSRYQIGLVVGHGSVTQEIDRLRKRGHDIPPPDKRHIKGTRAFRTYYVMVTPKSRKKAA
jgi:hypothetical protein